MTLRKVNILDRIGSLIPGYSGYAIRDTQRLSDKLLREKIANRLEEVEIGERLCDREVEGRRGRPVVVVEVEEADEARIRPREELEPHVPRRLAAVVCLVRPASLGE